MKRIQILMSTYNGEKYIKEQIDSILAQDCREKLGVELCLLVRDDGSKDATQKILNNYSKQFPQQVSWYQGENIGVIKSFFDLVAHSKESADYYALADQDDYWKPEKIRVGIEALDRMKEETQPHLYCCRPLLVDENLKPLVSEIERSAMRPSFQNALIENIVTGCTIVMNRTLRDMVQKNPPQFTVMHDWWFYLVASCFGEVYYDETSYICYRQHGGNVVGTNVSRWKEFKDRVSRFKGNRRNISNQLLEFLRIYEDWEELKNECFGLDQSKIADCLELARQLVDSRKSLIKRIHLVKSGTIYRQRKGDDRIFRLILLSGSF